MAPSQDVHNTWNVQQPYSMFILNVIISSLLNIPGPSSNTRQGDLSWDFVKSQSAEIGI